jgi:hypothetical protein
MGTRHSPRQPSKAGAKAVALLGGKVFAGDEALPSQGAGKTAGPFNLDTDIEKNVEAFIRALAGCNAK